MSERVWVKKEKFDLMTASASYIITYTCLSLPVLTSASTPRQTVQRMQTNRLCICIWEFSSFDFIPFVLLGQAFQRVQLHRLLPAMIILKIITVKYHIC